MASLVVVFASVVASLFLVTQVSAVSSSNSGAGIIYKLQVKYDVTLERAHQNYNYLQYLLVAKHPGNLNKRSLVRFEDLPYHFCPLHKIRWAKMYLYFVDAVKPIHHTITQTPYITRYIHTYRVKKHWTESQATSRFRFSNIFGTFEWSKAYLGLDGSDAESRPQSSVVPIYTNRPSGWVEFDVTRAVRTWRRGAQNNGLLIRATNEDAAGRYLRFASNADRNKGRHAFINVLCSN